MPTLEDALQLLNERKFAIIPLHSPDMDPKTLPDFVRIRVTPGAKEYNERDVGKMPLIAWDEWKGRLPRPAEVEGWWKKFPGANIGATCGEHSRIFVTDADTDIVLQYMESLGVIPGLTLTAKTGRGYQFYFKWPGFEVSNSLGQIMLGLDIKGMGGYVVSPPSRHRLGVDYTWVEGVDEPMPAPEELLEIIRQAGRRKQQKQALPQDEITRLLQGPHTEPGRHPAAKTLFTHLVAIGTPERAMREFAVTWSRNACQPPFPDHEAQKIVDWALAEESKKKRNPEEPRMERQGDDFIFTWPDLGIKAVLTDLHRMGDRIQGTLDITSEAMGDIHYADLVLGSTDGREKLTHPKHGKLVRVRGDLNWDVMIERICKMTSIEWRKGAPTVSLKSSQAPKAEVLALDMTGDGDMEHFLLFPKNETTVLFADGGTGKSSIALFICVLLAIQGVSSLYLDWESTIEEHEDRLRAILAGLGHPTLSGTISYRRMARALWEEIANLRAEIDRLKIGFVVVDSYAPAAGMDAEGTEAGVRTMNALYQLPATRLMTSHVSKQALERSDGAWKPFGSVFISNLARSVWEARQGDQESSDIILLRFDHRKTNRGRRLPPRGYQLSFEESKAGLEVIRVGWRKPGSISINGHRDLEDRIEDLLTSRPGLEVGEIVKELGLDSKSGVHKALERGVARKIFVNLETRPGIPGKWSVKARRASDAQL